MHEILQALKADQYKLGNCEIKLYDRRSEEFPPDCLFQLWDSCRRSGRRGKLGILPQLFCGMTDLSAPAIVSYLNNKPVLIPGLRSPEGEFIPSGLAFPSTLPVTGGTEQSERSMFAGYGFFKHIYGKPEMEILAMLGICWMFNEFNVSAIHGLRYQENALTAKFMAKFGFLDNGIIPKYMLQNGKLVGAVSSTLFIERFAGYTERKLLELYGQGVLQDGRLS